MFDITCKIWADCLRDVIFRVLVSGAGDKGSSPV